jgi:AraC-like DNA-binding protein
MTSPLSNGQVFRSRQVDETVDHISRVFCHHRFSLAGGHRGIDTEHNQIVFADISLNYLRYGAASTIEAEGLGDFFLFEIPMSGTSIAEVGQAVGQSHFRQGCVLPPDRPFRIAWSADCSKMMVRVAREILEQNLARLLDAPLTEPLQFPLTLSFDSQPGAGLRRMFDYIFSEADVRDSVFVSPTVQKQMECSLLTTLLLWQNHNYSNALHRRGCSIAPRYVRRAEEFIRAHAHQPLTLLDVAAETAVSVRTLQISFKRFRGVTPMSYLKGYRLDQVRVAIEKAEPGTTLRHIATYWGFSDMSRFAANYRRRFHELPSETLRYCPDDSGYPHRPRS